jgi:hypothetical protein
VKRQREENDIQLGSRLGNCDFEFSLIGSRSKRLKLSSKTGVANLFGKWAKSSEGQNLVQIGLGGPNF